MACGCGGTSSRSQRVEYQVKFKTGETQQFSTSQEAQTAIRAAGGGSLRAVPVK